MSDNKYYDSPVKTFQKSGYEIRLDVLRLAYDIVNSEFKAKIDITETYTDLVTPTVDDILVAADKLYSFVNQSKR